MRDGGKAKFREMKPAQLSNFPRDSDGFASWPDSIEVVHINIQIKCPNINVRVLFYLGKRKHFYNFTKMNAISIMMRSLSSIYYF